MASKNNKVKKSLNHLKAAFKQYDKEKTELNFLTVVKAFETLLEYSWRELKRLVESEGLEAPSPKMAIKQAVKLSWISQGDLWLEAIDARNSSVHDYFGITEDEFCELAYEFMMLVEKTDVLT
jgi:pyruvate-formate lyase